MKAIISDLLETVLSNRSVIQALYGLIMLSIWVFALLLFKRVLLSTLGKWTKNTENIWDDIILQSINTPMFLLILGSGPAFIGFYLPFSLEFKQYSALLFKIFIVIASVLFANNIFKRFVDRNVSLPILNKISIGVVKGLIQVIIVGMGILIILDIAGISITPILASLGIGSLAVALALQDTLSNFFSGIYMAIDKPIKKGDFIKIEGGEQGYVLDIGWRSTRVRTLPNNVVLISNVKLMGSTITNYYQPDTELAVLVEVGVHYNSDLKYVEKVVQEEGKNIMLTVPGGVSTFDPFIRFHTFAESSINFTVILRGKEFVDNYLIKHEFIKALHARFKKENIVIPFPIRTIEFSERKPETVPEISKGHQDKDSLFEF